MSRRRGVLLLLLGALAVGWLPGGVAEVAAAEYTLETTATYDVRPRDGEIDVTVAITFTNTTPDPDGQFSVFDELKLAVHDDATQAAASDKEGKLGVRVAVERNVNVATIALREDLRYEETAKLQLRYTLPDSDDPRLRVRPSLVVFPAWGFGTSSRVRVEIPDGFEVRVDGDPLTVSEGSLTSGPIDDPSRWLALVTATRPAEMVAFDATVPLDGGTADLQVRAFADDEAWGQRTLDLVARALPLLEDEIGLPYPRVGGLVLAEAVASNRSGFAETSTSGTEILVAFDQPPFTALHQVAHVWLSSDLVASRWIREGMASAAAGAVAGELDVARPFDPVAEAAELQQAAFALDGWGASAGPEAESWAHAASWAFMSELRSSVGADALRAVLVRVAASIGPYASAEIEAAPSDDQSAAPQLRLDSRSFLDHLETVADADLAERFRATVLSEADGALLPARAEARAAFEELIDAAAGWGPPDPVVAAMTTWDFEAATAGMAAAGEWLQARDLLLADMQAAGLAAPDRLQQTYRSFGGGPEAVAELEIERAVVEAYRETAADVNEPRTFVERIGLVGGADPDQQLALAHGRFADGDLRGAAEAIAEAGRILASAESGGMVRLVSAGLVMLALAVLAVVLFRRRASYTAAR